MKRTLTIQLENNSNEGDEHDDETIVERVLELIKDGFTSGYEPTWSIDEEQTAPRVYRVTANIGKAKHVVRYHDGEKKHADGSPFYDIDIFKNKPARDKFIKELRAKGYTEI